ncbi:MAG: hypothetical protein E7553_01115 [Ruminococcaceae bacterium]|nr:hypothetical protein [Oscillospiraceae bacterium]
MKRLLSFLVCICLLMTAVPFAVSAASATWDFARLEGYYKTQGRVDLDGTALEMDTTSSGFEFYFNGSGNVTLTAQVRCSYSTDLYLTVIVDGVRSRLQVDAGKKSTVVTKTLTLASGLASGVHHIEVYKQSEAIVSQMKVTDITFSGTPLATPPFDKITMEVIGDSISSGASMWSASSDQSIPADYPYFLDGTKTYAYLTGEALGANVRVTQASGYGCVSGFNTDGLNLQQLFPYTNYWRDRDLYEFDPCAQLVVINLGTNDYQARSKTGLTAEEFQAGAQNLMTMARQKNPDAKIVWCTGMMGVAFPGTLQKAVDALGGAENGFYYVELPYGADGGYAHPNVAQHKTAADVLTAFIKTNCLSSDYFDDFATAAELEQTLQTAKASAPSTALDAAMMWAQAELDWGTTDGYRLGCRNKALKDAMAQALSVDLMPRKGVATTPVEADGSYVWPYYGNKDSVTLYKGGDTYYWPHIETLLAPRTININETPYLRLKTSGNAYWNVHIQYKDTAGNAHGVNASTLAGNGDVDFGAGDYDLTLDIGSYIRSAGHADANGNLPVLYVNITNAGNMDVFTTWYTCALVSHKVAAPTAITGQYTVKNGILCDVPAQTTVSELLDVMDNAAYLSVTDAEGASVSGMLMTGMRLKLTVNGTIVQEAVIAVKGDVDMDGKTATTDCRLILKYTMNASLCDAAQAQAGDVNGDGVANTADVRVILGDLM